MTILILETLENQQRRWPPYWLDKAQAPQVFQQESQPLSIPLDAWPRAGGSPKQRGMGMVVIL